MIGENQEELLHRLLDGEATPEEAARARALLTASPEARARRDDLENLFRALGAVEPVDPPAGWKEDLVRALRERQPLPAPAERGGVWSGLSGTLRRQLTPARAYAFAAGVIAGVALFAAFQPASRLDRGSLPGTMLPADRVRDARPTDEQLMEFPGGRAVLRTRAAGESVLAEIDLEAREPVQVEVRFDPGAALVGFEQSPGAAAQVHLGAGAVRIEHHGRGMYRLLLNDKGSAAAGLKVILQAGGSTQEQVLQTRR